MTVTHTAGCYKLFPRLPNVAAVLCREEAGDRRLRGLSASDSETKVRALIRTGAKGHFQ